MHTKRSGPCYRHLAILLVLVAVAATTAGVPPPSIHSQDPHFGPPPPGEGIPPGAVLVDAGRFRECRTDVSACFYEVYQAVAPGPALASDDLNVLSINRRPYQCSITTKSRIGTHVGALTNNTWASYDNGPPVPNNPWYMNSGYNSTWAASGYRWSNLTGPTPSPA